MTRPRCKYNIEFYPRAKNFCPDGKVCGKSEIVELKPEEAEALRLKDVRGLDQIRSAKAMKVSQSTFQRVLTVARRKVSEALIKGKEIKIIEQKLVKNKK